MDQYANLNITEIEEIVEPRAIYLSHTSKKKNKRGKKEFRSDDT